MPGGRGSSTTISYETPGTRTHCIKLHLDLWRQHAVPLVDAPDDIAGAQLVQQGGVPQRAPLEAGGDAEGVDELGVQCEVSIESPPLLIGGALAEGPDDVLDLVLCHMLILCIPQQAWRNYEASYLDSP